MASSKRYNDLIQIKNTFQNVHLSNFSLPNIYDRYVFVGGVVQVSFVPAFTIINGDDATISDVCDSKL